MGKNQWFQFRQFRINQENTALKVGTDAVLLGSWCDAGKAGLILDVGTGTGIIALLLAQRTSAFIDAVEVNGEAVRDARSNFDLSPWRDRLKIFHMDFNLLPDSQSGCYDLIVSNPPYFSNSLISADRANSMARHDLTLTFHQLITGSKRLLKPDGRLSVILPASELDNFREMARLEGFYLRQKCMVVPILGKPANRVLVDFSLLPTYPVASDLVILDSPGKYSPSFIELTKQFYLFLP